MASPQPGTILKEGYLTKERPLKSNAKNWWVLAQDRGQGFSCYKDHSKRVLKEKIFGSGIDMVEVDKQKHDNYISLKFGKKIVHLRAENRQQRDEWYGAFQRWFRPKRAPIATPTAATGSEEDVLPTLRKRLNTEQSHTKPPVSRGKRPGDPQSSPSLDNIFQNELKAAVSKPRTQLNAIVEVAEDSDVAKVKQSNLCCVRHHVVAHNGEGVNMADLDVVYENVHFVRSEKDHIDEIASRKGSLLRVEDLYNLNHDLVTCQANNEGIYETTINDEPHGTDESVNNLNPPQDSVHPPEDFDRNIPVEGNHSLGRNSHSSIEDNTLVPDQPAHGPLPPVPVHTGAQLHKKMANLKSEQRQPHGIEKSFSKSSLVGERVKIKFMEHNDAIWVIGTEECGMQLRGALRVGDQLIKVNKQILNSAMYARETIRTTDEDQVSLVLKRIPHGYVCMFTRLSPHDDLGIRLEGNEINEVDPCGLAATRGNLRPEATGVTGRMCNWAITEINAQAVDLFASTEDITRVFRQAGKDVAFVVQPVDFIQMMRDRLNTEASLPKS